jgi:hypothetical protein
MNAAVPRTRVALLVAGLLALQSAAIMEVDGDWSCGGTQRVERVATDVVIYGPGHVVAGIGCLVEGQLMLKASRKPVATPSIGSVTVIIDNSVITGGIEFNLPLVGATVRISNSLIGCSTTGDPFGAAPTSPPTTAGTSATATGTPAPSMSSPQPSAPNATANNTNTTQSPTTAASNSTTNGTNTTFPTTSVVSNLTSTSQLVTTTLPPATTSAATTDPPETTPVPSPTYPPLSAPFAGRGLAAPGLVPAWPATLVRCSDNSALRFTHALRYTSVYVHSSALCSQGAGAVGAVAAVALDGDVEASLVSFLNSIVDVSSRGADAGYAIRVERLVTWSRLVVHESSLTASCLGNSVGDCAAIAIASVSSSAGLEVKDGSIIECTSDTKTAAAVRLPSLDGAVIAITPRLLTQTISATQTTFIGGPFGTRGSALTDSMFLATSPMAAWGALFSSLQASWIAIRLRNSHALGVTSALQLSNASNSTVLIGGAAIECFADSSASAAKLTGLSGYTSVVMAAVRMLAAPYQARGTAPRTITLTSSQGVAIRFIGCELSADAVASLFSEAVYIGPAVASSSLELIATVVNSSSSNQAVGLYLDNVASSAVFMATSSVNVNAGSTTACRLSNVTASTVYVIDSDLRGYTANGIEFTYVAPTDGVKAENVFVANALRLTPRQPFAVPWRGATGSGISKCSVAPTSNGTVALETVTSPAFESFSCSSCDRRTDCPGNVRGLAQITASVTPPGSSTALSTSAAPVANTTPAPPAGNTTAAPSPAANATMMKCACYGCDTLPLPLGVAPWRAAAVAASRNASVYCLPRDLTAGDERLMSTADAVAALLVGRPAAARRLGLPDLRSPTESTTPPPSKTRRPSTSRTANASVSESPPLTRTASRSVTLLATPSSRLTDTAEVVPTRSATESFAVEVPPYRTVLARAMNAAGFSDANAYRLSAVSSAVLGLTAFVMPLTGNKGANLERIAGSVECQFDQFDDTLLIPPYRDVVYPYTVGRGPLAHFKGAIITALALILVPQAVTALVLRRLPFHYKLRVVCGVVAVACLVYFAGTAAYYSTLVITAGGSFGERMIGVLGVLVTATVVAFPAGAVTSMPTLYLAYRMFDRGARRYDQLAVRLYLFVDVAAACLFALAAGIRLPLTAEERDAQTRWRGFGHQAKTTVFSADKLFCSLSAGMAVLVAAGYVIYILSFRPLADRAQLAFVLILAVIQLAVAVTALVTVHVPHALPVLGVLSLAQLVAVCSMVAVVLLIRAVRQSRREAERTAQEFEANKEATADKEMPLLRLPDSDDEADANNGLRPAQGTDVHVPAVGSKDGAGYAGLSLFDEEREVNERHFGLSPAKQKRKDAMDEPMLSAAELRRRHVERLRKADEEEQAALKAALAPTELLVAKHEDRALRNLARYNTYGYGRTPREVNGELLATWVRNAQLDPQAMAVLVGGGEALLDTSVTKPAIANGTVRVLEQAIADKQNSSRHARAAVLYAAQQQLKPSPPRGENAANGTGAAPPLVVPLPQASLPARSVTLAAAASPPSERPHNPLARSSHRRNWFDSSDDDASTYVDPHARDLVLSVHQGDDAPYTY